MGVFGGVEWLSGVIKVCMPGKVGSQEGRKSLAEETVWVFVQEISLVREDATIECGSCGE